MPEVKSNQKWKRLCWRVLRIYAACCAVLVTALMILWLWSCLFNRPVPLGRGSHELFMTSYFSYMETEYPQRRRRFKSMAEALCGYLVETNMEEPDLFRYLGRPDQFFVTNVLASEPRQPSITNRIVLYAYVFDRAGGTNKSAATILVSDGKAVQCTLSDNAYKEMEKMDLRPFAADPASNPQGGADGRQPFSPEANPTPAAAASRRSP